MKKQSNNILIEHYSLRLSKELMQRIRKKAAECGLSVAAFIRMVLTRATK